MTATNDTNSKEVCRLAPCLKISSATEGPRSFRSEGTVRWKAEAHCSQTRPMELLMRPLKPLRPSPWQLSFWAPRTLCSRRKPWPQHAHYMTTPHSTQCVSKSFCRSMLCVQTAHGAGSLTSSSQHCHHVSQRQWHVPPSQRRPIVAILNQEDICCCDMHTVIQSQSSSSCTISSEIQLRHHTDTF